MTHWEGLNPPYSTIVADPPWDYPDGYRTYSRSSVNGEELWRGAVTRKWLPYSTMALAAIAGLPVAELAGGDTRMFLWTTNRYLPAAIVILTGWGFKYRQILTWAKTDGNMGGSVAANSTEFLLVGVKGQPRRLARAKSSIITAPQPKTHSVKPKAFGDLIEQVSPGPYVELFARSPRLGWDSWGLGYESGAA